MFTAEPFNVRVLVPVLVMPKPPPLSEMTPPTTMLPPTLPAFHVWLAPRRMGALIVSVPLPVFVIPPAPIIRRGVVPELMVSEAAVVVLLIVVIELALTVPFKVTALVTLPEVLAWNAASLPSVQNVGAAVPGELEVAQKRSDPLVDQLPAPVVIPLVALISQYWVAAFPAVWPSSKQARTRDNTNSHRTVLDLLRDRSERSLATLKSSIGPKGEIGVFIVIIGVVAFGVF